jgi:protein-S-isoprenylcysteine O-methyltransferase Ste14
MFLGAGMALGGTAIFYQSLYLVGYTALFFLVTHVFVVYYEEPVLERQFGVQYVAYCRVVGRWRPKLKRGRLLS